MIPLPPQQWTPTTPLAHSHAGLPPYTGGGNFPFQLGHFQPPITNIAGNTQQHEALRQPNHIVVTPTQPTEPVHAQTHAQTSDIEYTICGANSKEALKNFFARKDQQILKQHHCRQVEVKATLQYENINGKDQIVDIQFDKGLELDQLDHKHILDQLNSKCSHTHTPEQRVKVIHVLFAVQTIVLALLAVGQSFFSFIYTI